MNYLWELVLKAKAAGVELSQLRFRQADNYSPYLELSLESINQIELPGIMEIEVNTYYRFFEIFKDMFHPEAEDYRELRDGLVNLMLHVLASNDVRSGMTRTEYHKKLLLQYLCAGGFGADIRTALIFFTKPEQDVLLGGWLKMYQTGNSLTIFTDMMEALIADSIVYHNNAYPSEILIYTSCREDSGTKQKIWLLTEVFLDITFRTEVYYEYHFGILGMEHTMVIDEIAMY